MDANEEDAVSGRGQVELGAGMVMGGWGSGIGDWARFEAPSLVGQFDLFTRGDGASGNQSWGSVSSVGVT